MPARKNEKWSSNERGEVEAAVSTEHYRWLRKVSAARNVGAMGAKLSVRMFGSLCLKNSKDAWQSFPYGFRTALAG